MREALTRHTRTILDNAQSSARTLKQDFVGAEHLVLGILDDQECQAARTIQAEGANLAELRASLVALLPKGKEDPVVTGALPMSPKAQRLLNVALVKAQGIKLTTLPTGMLLLALLEELDSPLRQALGSAGVDIDLLLGRLERPSVNAEA